MGKNKKQKETTTHPAGESQKRKDQRNIPVGVDKRGGQSPK